MRKHRAVPKMKEDPSKPPCRGEASNRHKLLRTKAVVVNVMVKRRDQDQSRQVRIRETSANEPPLGRIESPRWHQNRGRKAALGRAWREPTYWPCGVRCRGGVTLIWALVGNLRTCMVMLREKAQVVDPRGRNYRCTKQGRTAS
jgi:hypothetical protein